MEKAKLIQKKKNLEIPSIKGVWPNPGVSKGLNKAFRGSENKKDARVPGSIVEETEEPTGTGAGLKECKQGLGHLSWAKSIHEVAHGGRSTLEYELKNPAEADSIHVVFLSG